MSSFSPALIIRATDLCAPSRSETPGLLQRGRTRARTNEGGNSNEDSEDDMDGFFDSDEPAAPRGNGPAARSNTPSGSTVTGEGDGAEERQGPSNDGHGHPSSATGPGPGGAHNNNGKIIFLIHISA